MNKQLIKTINYSVKFIFASLFVIVFSTAGWHLNQLLNDDIKELYEPQTYTITDGGEVVKIEPSQPLCEELPPIYYAGI